MKFVILCLCTFSLTLGEVNITKKKVQSCMGQFKTAKDCIKGKVTELKKQKAHVNISALGDDVGGCFKTSGCNLGKLKELIEMKVPKLKEKTGAAAGATKKDRMKIFNKLPMGNPVKGVEDKLQAKAEKCGSDMKAEQGKLKTAAKECMIKKFANVDMKDSFKGGEHEHDVEAGEAIEDDPMSPGENAEKLEQKLENMNEEKREEMMKHIKGKHMLNGILHKAAFIFMDEVCPTAKQATVAKCVEDAYKKHIPKEFREADPLQKTMKKMQKHKEFCKKRKECTAGITEECKKMKEEMSKQKCLCWSEAVKAKGESEFATCMKDSNKKDDSGKNFGEFNPKKMHSHWRKKQFDAENKGQKDRMVKDGCESGMQPHYDPCSPEGMAKMIMKKKEHHRQAKEKMGH